jgi:ubiquinone/menaquinone biosynthesis C-methylase UbiE
MDDGRTAMAEACRVLRPGGRLRLEELLQAPDSRTVRFAHYRNPGVVHDYELLPRVLEESGFSDPTMERLYWGVSHMKGDFSPLKGEETGVFVVSAEKV